MPLTIRTELEGDAAAIRRILLAAFPTPEEADLVDQLRTSGDVLLSLVAEAGGGVAGHVLFTRMFIGETPGVALAPLAVLPAHQRQGIGSALVRDGLTQLREAGERIVTVLGSPAYYPRFGFSVDMAKDLVSPFPPEYYMALQLQPSAMVSGAVRYAGAFGITAAKSSRR